MKIMAHVLAGPLAVSAMFKILKGKEVRALVQETAHIEDVVPCVPGVHHVEFGIGDGVTTTSGIRNALIGVGRFTPRRPWRKV